MGARSKSLSPDAVDAVWLALLAALVWSVSGALITRAALDTDAINLALAIDRFDLFAHQPHPPGYVGYVILLRGVAALLPLDPLDVVVLLSRLLVVATLPLVYAAARLLGDRRAGLTAAAVCATSPLALYYAIDGQTHAAEMAVAAALLWRLAVTARGARSPLGNAAIVGALLAIGGSLRPSFALIAVGPPLWVYWRRWRELAVIAAIGAAGTAAWAIPTLVAAGGWSQYRAASDALIGMFVRATSPLSDAADSRVTADNWALLGITTAYLIAPLVVAALGRRPGARWPLIYAGLSAAPALAFFAAVFIAEPGYALGLLPPVAVAAALWCRRWWSLAALAVAQLVAFAVIPTTDDAANTFVPGIDEIVFRQGTIEIAVDRVSAGVAPGERVLVIADLGPNVMYRQLPLLRPRTEVLQVHSARLTIVEATTISLMRADDWIAAPGPALLVDGPPSILRVRADYDRVAIGPLYSPQLVELLRAQTSCSIPPLDRQLSTPHLPASCFADRALEIEGHRFEWGRDADEVVAR